MKVTDYKPTSELIAALQRATERWGVLLPAGHAARLTPFCRQHFYRLLEAGVFDTVVVAGEKFVVLSSIEGYLRGDK